MSIFKRLRDLYVVALLIALLVSSGVCKKKEQPKNPERKDVDSGSFGIFVGGKRIATEKFHIEQGESFSTISSEFATEEGTEKVRQEAELQIGPSGELRHYKWRELAPGKAQVVVEPSDEFLLEHITPNPPEKPSEQPLLIPVSTVILDDYFFSQREVLMWRYLAQACGSDLKSGCALPKTSFGALVPRQATSVMVTIEYKGKEKISIKGADENLDRFELSTQDDVWTVYLDSEMKLVKIDVPAEKTEVLRD